MAIISGKIDKSADNALLSDYLYKNYPGKNVAVMTNEEIISRENFSKTIINPSDKVEIVEFMSGG